MSAWGLGWGEVGVGGVRCGQGLGLGPWPRGGVQEGREGRAGSGVVSRGGHGRVREAGRA
jgi:hypothetical protein